MYIQYKELKKIYNKNKLEVQELNQDLESLKQSLQKNEKRGNMDIYNNSLLEYDIEKANAGLNLLKMEIEAIRSYYTTLQKEYERVGNELLILREQHALDKEKCAILDTNLINLSKDHETVIKERHATIIQIQELKKQIDLMFSKKDPLAETLMQVLKERQNSVKTLDKKLAETSEKMKQELAKAEELSNKLSKDKDFIEKMKYRNDVAELQLVQIEAKIKAESNRKKNSVLLLDHIKQSISTNEKVNKDLQKDVDVFHSKYNKAVKATSILSSKINKKREENFKDTAEIKKLQEELARLKESETV
jgi:chromosome segregation ATPase